MKAKSKGTAFITGASSGIGAVYADRLAKRGHDLILVARNRERLQALATRLTGETGRSIRVVAADLNNQADLAQVERELRTDPNISVLINNAGAGAPTALLDAEVERLGRMIDLNVTAIVRLTHAVMPAFVERGGGTIINIASVVGIYPELLNGVYGGTKAFVLAFSRSLHKEFGERKIQIQVVLPGATATDFWDNSDVPLAQVPKEMVMDVSEMVDAALAGLDRGELVTIPSLPDIVDWETYEASRQKLLPNLSLRSPAPRYGVTAMRQSRT